MADNINVSEGTGKAIAADDITGVMHQRIKIVMGGDGVSEGDVSSTNHLPIRLSSTGFVASTLNSTTAQLATTATFTGMIEDAFNQPSMSVLITSDQSGIFTVKQYIDSAGTKLASSIAYNIFAGVGFARSLVINGNYCNVTFKNTGDVTTSDLRVDVAYGAIPATSVLNNAPISLNEIAGVAVLPKPDGTMRVSCDPTTVFYDSFETLNTTDMWTTGGTVTPTASAGSLIIAPNTTANATSWITSKPIFSNTSGAFLQPVMLVQLLASVITGTNRFWGLGTITSPTVTAPIVNGSVFEIESTTGKLHASCYVGGVRTQTVALVRPVDGAVHRYSIYYKTSRVYFELDNVAVANIALPASQVAQLSLVAGVVNGVSTVATAPVLTISMINCGDSGRNATQLADGTFPWRKAKIDPNGGLSVSLVDGARLSYSVSALNIAPANNATDILTICGSATKTVRILRVTLTATQSTASQRDVVLLKRSTASSGGTSTVITPSSHDSANATSSAVTRAYTANPTLGTLVANVRARKVFIGTTTGNSDEMIHDFGVRPSQALVLRGVNESLAINLNGATSAGGLVNINIEYTEE